MWCLARGCTRGSSISSATEPGCFSESCRRGHDHTRPPSPSRGWAGLMPGRVLRLCSTCFAQPFAGARPGSVLLLLTASCLRFRVA